MSEANEPYEHSDLLAYNQYPRYPSSEAQCRAQNYQVADTYGAKGRWSQLQHQPGPSSFNSYQHGEENRSFAGLEALSRGPYSPGSTSCLTLGSSTPSTGQFPRLVTQPSTSFLDSTIPTRDQTSQACSLQTPSPTMSNDLTARSLTVDQKNQRPRRSASAPEGRNKPRRKTHNAIEKRYRTRLNDKISELRCRIPSLRDAGTSGLPTSTGSVGDSSCQKINKANILEKATEYIQYLETCNRNLQARLDQALMASRSTAGQGGNIPHEHIESHGSNHSLPILLRSQLTEPFAYTVHDLLPDDTATFR